MHLLKECFQERKEEETIDIITFNSVQRDLIEDLVEAECDKDLQFRAAYKAEITRYRDGEYFWSTNWWKNPEQEIEKICRVVDSLV